MLVSSRWNGGILPLAKINNISFNGERFVVLHYGKDIHIKSNTIYLKTTGILLLEPAKATNTIEYTCLTMVGLIIM